MRWVALRNPQAFSPETAPDTQRPWLISRRFWKKNTSALRNCWRKLDSPVAETSEELGAY